MMKVFIFPLNIYKFYYFWEWTNEKNSVLFQINALLLSVRSFAHIYTHTYRYELVIPLDRKPESCHSAFIQLLLLFLFLFPPLGKPK